jgi:hypothetical protein
VSKQHFVNTDLILIDQFLIQSPPPPSLGDLTSVLPKRRLLHGATYYSPSFFCLIPDQMASDIVDIVSRLVVCPKTVHHDDVNPCRHRCPKGTWFFYPEKKLTNSWGKDKGSHCWNHIYSIIKHSYPCFKYCSTWRVYTCALFISNIANFPRNSLCLKRPSLSPFTKTFHVSLATLV